MRLALLSSVLVLFTGCALTGHEVKPSTLGTPRSSADLLAVIDEKGPVELETVDSADWAVPRAGLINLENPKAKAAGLTDGDEPVQIYFHVLHHPTQGDFIVDTGVERAMRDHPEQAAIQGIVASKMHFDRMTFHAPLAEWLEAHKVTPKGVFLTHLHPDHISGLRDAPATAVVYTGPGESAARAFQNLVVKANVDRALEGKGPTEELQFQKDPAGRFEGVLDLFGDGSVWALATPGHTPGSVAFLVRSTKGPVLLTGDTCHTRWGWEHDVEPGEFTADRPKNAESLKRLRALVAEHPAIDVRLGHQR